MDQISRPLLFLLIAVVGFAGAWMTVLRPSAEGGEETAAVNPVAAPVVAAPGVKGLGGAVDKAKGAAAAEAASGKVVQEVGETAGGSEQLPSNKGAAAPAPVPASEAPPKAAQPPARPAAARKTTVILFAGKGADDRVARDVVRSARRPGVRTIVATLREVGKYKDLLGSVSVTQAPTILVIGANRTAQRIEGLPDARQVEQALHVVAP